MKTTCRALYMSVGRQLGRENDEKHPFNSMEGRMNHRIQEQLEPLSEEVSE
jgi:uracil-DNA glycosylase